MNSYLYGAAVQGIQSFIFQTNELADIVGASELVQDVCTKMFKELVGNSDEIIVQAAGNIKCIFHNEDACRKAVREFPKKVMEAAPGITVSQAVVEYSGNFKDAVDELEKRLRAQRNKPAKSLTVGLMGIERSRKTGLPAVERERKDSVLDEGTKKKKEKNQTIEICQKSFGVSDLPAHETPFDIKDMTWRNDWIAIIHADGNGLGEIVRAIGSDAEKLKTFSANLEKATQAAAAKTFATIQEDYSINGKWGSKRIPLRPVVLSGDDMTIICRGDIAFDYAKEFLKNFEAETKNIATDKDGNAYSLTACAGIAYIKSSYPFYYGYQLAEALCTRAKKDAKLDRMKEANGGNAPSCLMFHKVQSSFVEDYDEIVKKELTANDEHRFDFGPYYLTKQNERWTIERLEKNVKTLAGMGDSKEGNAVKSALRKWMTAMHDDHNAADQLKERAKSIIQGQNLRDIFNDATTFTNSKSPAYDILSLTSVTYQDTKGDKK